MTPRPRAFLLTLTLLVLSSFRFLSGGTVSPATTGPGGDWTHWRGPRRDGHSPERRLPNTWSRSGENLRWTAPYGGRSTPIVLGDRVFLQNAAGDGKDLQERVLCFDAETGDVLWEHRFNIYQSDVPPHRVGWASPVGDPATGNVYAFGVGGLLIALSNDGQRLWERSLAEEFGLITTHGGRTVAPVIERDLVIVSGLNAGWGDQARGSQRFFAFDKRNGETVWVSAPGGRPFDTTYSPPIATTIDGERLLIAGGGDGAFHAFQPATGVPVWTFALSKRGINSGAVLSGTTAIVSQGEENLDTSEMGLIAAIDATARGDLGPEAILWKVPGFLGGFSSPVLDGERVYQIDNAANLVAFDVTSGEQLWTLNLGTIQRASPVLADGKLYVGTVNGTFYIIRPGDEAAEILDQEELGTDAELEEIFASVAVSDGRVYVASTRALYSLGLPGARDDRDPDLVEPSPDVTASDAGPPSHLQVVPTELVLAPGDRIELEARLFDDKGRLVGPTDAAIWSLDGLQGTVSETGDLEVAPDAVAQGGLVRATVGELTGHARARIFPPLPWREDFEALPDHSVPAHWINATGKYVVRQEEGNRVLVKRADNPFLKRARTYIGPSDWSDYTVAVDVRASEARRQMGDAGVIAQRYALILFGNHQRLELHASQPETERTVTAPFSWEPDTWYRVKLRVENGPDGTVRTLGKAWPRREAEPSEWTLEREDPIPNRQGSPGIYANAINEVFFDNLEVIANP